MVISEQSFSKIIEYKKEFIQKMWLNSIGYGVLIMLISLFNRNLENALLWGFGVGLTIFVVMGLYWTYVLYYKYELEFYINEIETRLSSRDLELFNKIEEKNNFL